MQKKITIIIPSLGVGGTERHLLGIIPKLIQKGFQIELLTTFNEGPLIKDFEAKGIVVQCALTAKQQTFIQKAPVFMRRLLRMSLGIFGIRVYLKQNPKINILHFYLPEAYIVGMLGAYLAGFKGHKIMSRRSLNCYQKKNNLVGLIERKLHPNTTVITANCQALLDQLEDEEGVLKSHLTLIYNGIEKERVLASISRVEFRKTLGLPEDALLMVKVANLIPYKGHEDLLIALSQIKEKLPQNWFLICLGRDDGILSHLKNKAQQLGIDKHIAWLGTRLDVANFLFSADIGILCPYENEGFSNAMLENMLAGLPMVVTDMGGNKEAVLNGETGFVVAPRDTKALANAILTLALNRDQAKQFGLNGQKRVETNFSLEACVAAYEKLYTDLPVT